jgi:hypothetical protein
MASLLTLVDASRRIRTVTRVLCWCSVGLDVLLLRSGRALCIGTFRGFDGHLEWIVRAGYVWWDAVNSCTGSRLKGVIVVPVGFLLYNILSLSSYSFADILASKLAPAHQT